MRKAEGGGMRRAAEGGQTRRAKESARNAWGLMTGARTCRTMARTALADAVRFLVVFALAFSMVFAGQGAAWAYQADASTRSGADGAHDGIALLEGEAAGDPGAEAPSDPGTGGTSGSGGSGGSGGVSYTVDGITLFYETPYQGEGWAACANSWEAIPAKHGALTSKGETLAFRVQLVWSDGSTSFSEGAMHPVTYRVDDPSVATVDTTGTVRAVANGTVTLTATCDGHSVSYLIDVSGQNNELYVESVTVVDGNGQPYDSLDGVQLEDLNQTVKLYARVTVVDPATGQKTDYYTSDGSLSSQTDGAITDIVWSVNDSNLGYVEESSGVYRPIEFANVQVIASSSAGLAGAAVTGSVWVTTFNPEKQEPGRNPQSSLTVRVYYEEAPGTIVSEKTFSRAEIEAMGTEYHTYTAVGGSSMFATASGRGVLFSKVLDAAGANINGISHFSFITADSGGREWGETVSYAMLFQTRYYFPQYDINKSVQEAVVVPPMLAIESNFRWYDHNVAGGDCSEDYVNMTDDTCFRLLFGATGSGQITTNKQIYWINTINVVLEGGPSTETGDGNGGNGGNGDGDGGGSPNASGQADSGTGSDDSTNAGSDEGLGDGLAGGSTTEGSDQAGEAGDTGRWSVYQIMNPNRSEVDLLDDENPWRAFALPLACGVTAAGAVQSGVWYRRQKRPLRAPAKELAKAGDA